MVNINTQTVREGEEKSNLNIFKSKKNRLKNELINIFKNNETLKKEKIIKDLQKNFVTSKDSIQKIKIGEKIEDIRGKEIHIELPAVGNFTGFKFNGFITSPIMISDNIKYPEIEKDLYSKKEISELLQAINKYMKELGIKADEDICYEKILDYQKTMKYFIMINNGKEKDIDEEYKNYYKYFKKNKYNFNSEAGNVLKEITGLNNFSYLLKDGYSMDVSDNFFGFNKQGYHGIYSFFIKN